MKGKESHLSRKKLVLTAAVLTVVGVTGIGTYHYRNPAGKMEETIVQVREEQKQLYTSQSEYVVNAEEYTQNDDEWEYIVKPDDTLEITAYTGESSNLSIPELLYGNKVTSVGDSAFYGYSNLESIDIPDSIESISDYAFANCDNLQTVTISENSRLREIGDRAFCEDEQLDTLLIPDGVQKIGEYAFYNCKAITNVQLGERLKYIGSAAFSGCKNLTYIAIDPYNEYFCSVNGILYDKDCTHIVSAPGGYKGVLKIPEGITEISRYAFSYCEKITEIEFSSSVKYIGDGAFENCNGLKSILIPETIEDVGTQIFAGCTEL